MRFNLECVSRDENMKKIGIQFSDQYVKEVVIALLESDIQKFLKTNPECATKENPISVLDVLGRDWQGTQNFQCKGSDFYKNVFYRLFNEMRPAAQQMGRLFKIAALEVGLKECLIEDGRGTKKSGYYKA